MKIDIYTLLGMVKDGKAPKKIKYQNEIYTTDDVEYFCCKSENRAPLFEHIFDYYSDYDALNEEVIILDKIEEEKKIPEKLDWNKNDFTYPEGNLMSEETADMLMEIQDKVNFILEYLKSKGE